MNNKKSRLACILKIIGINLCVFILLLEVALQGVNAIGHGNTNPVIRSVYSYIKPQMSWEEWFLVSYMDRGNMIYAGVHQPHPTRGWAMKPLAQFRAKPSVHYSINAQGYRSLYIYENKQDKYQVLIIGDSFTFGDELDDADTWPNLLQEKSIQLNVLNMAGSGYGTDQMLITLEEEIEKYHPDLVLAAIIDDNLIRATLPFRDYKKPLFVLDGKNLRLTNTPVGSPKSILDHIAHKKYFSYGRIQIINMLGYFWSDLTPMDSDGVCSEKCQILNMAILQKMQQVSSQAGSEFMLTYLPRGKEITEPSYVSAGEVFFKAYGATMPGYFVDPRSSFLKASFDKAPEHYHKNETLLLSGLVLEAIKGTASWQCEVEKNCAL